MDKHTCLVKGTGMSMGITKPSREILKSISVLYVEDDLAIQKQMCHFLRSTVGNVYTADTGLKGFEIYEKYRPDAVITDIRMPMLDGLEMACLIRELDKDVPILVTTAFNEQEYFLQSIDIQVNKYVLKPTNPFLLLDALAEVVFVLMEKKEKDFNNQYIRFVLDAQPTFMLATNQYGLEYINKHFLNFLGFSSLEEFKKSNKRLENWFVDVKGVPFSGKEKKNWLHNIINNPDREVLVYFKNKDKPGGAPEIYLVSCNRFPEIDKYFFSFSNITKIANEKENFKKQSITDILTGVFNRKKLIDTLLSEINRNLRYKTPLSLIMFDIDHFKKINDTYGHNAGDQVLQNITRIVAKNIRKSDTLARWGGDEFLILTPETDIKKARVLATKVSKSIKKLKIGENDHITSSFGVAQFKESDNIDTFVSRVDSALYRAKKAGRANVKW